MLDKKNIRYFRGSVNNVLDRFLKASKQFNGNIIVRITGDCPLIDVKIVDKVINNYVNNKVDYSSNVNPPTFPNGLDVEVFSLALLEKYKSKISSTFDKEHVTAYFRKNKKIKKINFSSKINYSNLSVTLDDYDDFKKIMIIFIFFKKKKINYQSLIKYLNKNSANFKEIKNRNDFVDLGIGQKLWKKAKSIIHGGNMLISKRSEFFLPELWPSYYSKSKGCHLWDLENNKLLDMALMGVGTNILGYSYSNVDKQE